MKLLIASDIHGAAAWCARLMEAIDKHQPDRVVLLGDQLYHGPRNDLPEDYAPKQVISMLNGIADKVLAVRGNCEAEVDQMVLDFPCMADYVELFDDQQRIFATHGHIFGPDNVPALPAGSALLYGHFHEQRDQVVDGIRFVNPGSVALPKDGKHGYAVYNSGMFELCTFEG